MGGSGRREEKTDVKGTNLQSVVISPENLMHSVVTVDRNIIC